MTDELTEILKSINNQIQLINTRLDTIETKLQNKPQRNVQYITSTPSLGFPDSITSTPSLGFPDSITSTPSLQTYSQHMDKLMKRDANGEWFCYNTVQN